MVEITLRNPGPESVKVQLVPRLENAVCLHSIDKLPVDRRSEVAKADGLTMLVHRVERAAKGAEPRPDIHFGTRSSIVAVTNTWVPPQR